MTIVEVHQTPSGWLVRVERGEEVWERFFETEAEAWADAREIRP